MKSLFYGTVMKDHRANKAVVGQLWSAEPELDNAGTTAL